MAGKYYREGAAINLLREQSLVNRTGQAHTTVVDVALSFETCENTLDVSSCLTTLHTVLSRWIIEYESFRLNLLDVNHYQTLAIRFVE